MTDTGRLGIVDVLDRLGEICLALPEVERRISHGGPSYFIRGRKQVVNVDDAHHGAEHRGFWCPAPPGVQQEMIDEDPVRFFRPPYVGHRGWLGVRLELPGDPAALAPPDWDEVTAIVRDAYRLVAPKSLAALVE